MNTEIVCIIDRSGSMQPLADDAIGGFNKFLEDQKAVRMDGECGMTFVQFDNVIETMYEGKPIADVHRLSDHTYKPRGMTALLDAVGMTLRATKQRLDKKQGSPEKPKVIVVILTDGFENASREYSRDRVRALIEEAQADGWSFVYLAANQDAFVSAQHLGINPLAAANATMTFAATGQGVRGTYAYASNATTQIRTTGSAR